MLSLQAQLEECGKEKGKGSFDGKVTQEEHYQEQKMRGKKGVFSAQNIGKSSKLRALFNLVPRKKEKFIGNIKENYRRENRNKRLKSEGFVDFSCADEYMI